MKIRSGFVSNSSSSSFLLVGVELKGLTEEQVEKLKDNGCEYDFCEEPFYIGIRWRDSGFGDRGVSIDEVEDATEKMKRLTGSENIRLYFGEVFD